MRLRAMPAGGGVNAKTAAFDEDEEEVSQEMEIGAGGGQSTGRTHRHVMCSSKAGSRLERPVVTRTLSRAQRTASCLSSAENVHSSFDGKPSSASPSSSLTAPQMRQLKGKVRAETTAEKQHRRAAMREAHEQAASVALPVTAAVIALVVLFIVWGTHASA